MTQDLLESFHDGVAVLTLNRPEARNALTPDMFDALSKALPRLALDSAVRAVVLTGAGKAFCAGGDVKRFAQAAASGESPMSFDERVNDLRMRMDVSRLLHEMAKPTLAVIPGAAAGAGLSLALACDLRLAASDAKFTTAFANIGLSGDFGASWFLTQLVGAGKARELFFDATPISAQAAHDIGFVNRVVPGEELESASKAWAQQLASLPTVTIGYMKKNLNLATRASLSDTLDAEAIHMIRTFETADHKAAAQAFVEKKKPVFTGH